MLEVGVLKNFNSGTYKAGVQLAGSLTTYFDDINVAKNIPSAAMVVGNYVIVAIPGGNPKDACIIATWPGGSPGGGAFLDLTDTPASYVDQAGKYVKVNNGEIALEFDSNVISITFIIDGGGSVITTGQKGHFEIPFACTITQATMLADQSGSIVMDIWKDTYANFPPTDADSITASAPPTISAAQKSQDATLTDWTTSISAGDILTFNVDSCSTITRVTISLQAVK